ncbi:Histone-lysine N-methyltransferase H3 lysine-4 specific [Venturia nashicola]|uniref:Histone-lysine N-methyltransferase n=1 Tax=Venturia nashicola TaxID=86259 RepID=A0A4Z1PMU6_9PEZI|nr:Histone-lysine N-methyltransferase [Venturia nashicola]TLD39117.1 Histone-lysine N-methyltransferase H3 lysine-4 specific [Venturia nashicola]
MKLTNILFAVIMASTTVSAYPIPEAAPEASPGYCHGFGQPCMKFKRNIERMPEILARMWNALSLESTPFPGSQNDATITKDNIELDSTPAKRSPSHRYCWRFGQPCMKRREGTKIFMPGSSEGVSHQHK